MVTRRQASILAQQELLEEQGQLYTEGEDLETECDSILGEPSLEGDLARASLGRKVG